MIVLLGSVYFPSRLGQRLMKWGFVGSTAVLLGMLGLSSAASAQQQTGPYYGPHMWGGGWWMFFGPLMMILFIAAIVVAPASATGASAAPRNTLRRVIPLDLPTSSWPSHMKHDPAKPGSLFSVVMILPPHGVG